MATETAYDDLGEAEKIMWSKYVEGIQGFAMKRDILIKALQVHLLLSKEHSCYRQRRNGER